MEQKNRPPRILYVSHRYHTNQVPIMKGWAKIGASVLFLVTYIGAIESHDSVRLHKLRPSLFTRLAHKIIDWKYNVVDAENKKSHIFRPDFYDVYRQIKNFRPDFVIIRNFSLGNLKIILICRLLGIKNIIMYVQEPVYGKVGASGSMKEIFRRNLFPSAVFSPVLYRGEERSKDILSEYVKYFVPLVCEMTSVKRETYCCNGKIKILDVGKYREYKNHFFVVDAISKMKHPENVEVTIIGQLTNGMEREYFNSLKEYVEERHLEKTIILRGNVDYGMMDEIYSQHDVLLLASKVETAGMVVLEAMSQGLCVISGTNCGLTCYLNEYECGISFPTNNISALVEILDEISEKKSKIVQLGQRAQKIAKKEFCFDKYKEGLNRILQAEYNHTI